MSDISKKILDLPPHARELIEKIVIAAKTTNKDSFDLKHWLMSKELYALFGLKLAMYHAVTHSPLNKHSFENILAETCNQVGIPASLPESATADIDIILNGKKTSLKSEGRIHNSIHISKFCELGWGPWEKAEDLYFKINKRSPSDKNRTFESRVDSYDAVLSLRHDDSSEKCLNYELVEVPISVFKRVLKIPFTTYEKEMAASSSKTKPKSFNVKTSWSGKKDDKEILVKFDGGGERKLTISIPKEATKVVATWSFSLEV